MVGFFKQFPTLSKTELRIKNPSLFMRIYRNDKEMVKKHPPFAKVNVVTNKRVDWVKRDLQMLGEVKRGVEDLSARKKPVRITLSSIGKVINQLSLLVQKEDKLLLTIEYIDCIKESVTDFQKRRINWSVKQLRDEELEFWKIVRMF